LPSRLRTDAPTISKANADKTIHPSTPHWINTGHNNAMRSQQIPSTKMYIYANPASAQTHTDCPETWHIPPPGIDSN